VARGVVEAERKVDPEEASPLRPPPPTENSTPGRTASLPGPLTGTPSQQNPARQGRFHDNNPPHRKFIILIL